MRAALKKGDKVVTIGGIHGVVSSVKEKTVVVKVDDNCKMEFSRSAISGIDAGDVKDEKSKKDTKDTNESGAAAKDAPAPESK